MALLHGLLQPIRGFIHFSTYQVKKAKPKRSAISLAGHEPLKQFLRPVRFSHAFQYAGENSNGLQDHRNCVFCEVKCFCPLLLPSVSESHTNRCKRVVLFKFQNLMQLRLRIRQPTNAYKKGCQYITGTKVERIFFEPLLKLREGFLRPALSIVSYISPYSASRFPIVRSSMGRGSCCC